MTTALAINSDIPGDVAFLLAEYAHVIDDGRYEAWPNLFTEQCLYRITTRVNHERDLPASIILCDSRAMLRDRVVSIRTANVFEPHRYRHLVSSTQVVEVGQDEWKLRSSYLVTRTMQDGTMTVFSTGEYQDIVVREQGNCLFSQRLVICDHGVINNLIALPL